MSKVIPNKINSDSIPKSLSAEDFNLYFSTIGNKVTNRFNMSNTTEPISTENEDHSGTADLFWKGPKSIYTLDICEVTHESILKNLIKLSDHSNLDVLGFDSKLLKLTADLIAPQVAYLVNLSIQEGYVPSDWKLARVTPIYKGKGDRNDMGNYRPIAVICHLAKIMEKEICIQFLKYLQEHDFITTDQSAYLKHHSTQTSMHRVVDQWLEAINDGQMVGVCFLDIQKCFDSISHELLLAKLRCYGVLGKELQWFESYLSERKQKVRCNGKLSTENLVNIGVPQGSILGPILFLLYANDLVNHVGLGICNCFADDTIIYVVGNSISEVKLKLQECLLYVNEWYTKNKLSVNVSKSNVLLISTQYKMNDFKKEYFKIYFDGKLLEYSHKVRYLGMMLDQTLSWKDHVSHISRQLAQKVGLLQRLSSFLPMNTLLTIYNTHVQPCFDYGLTIWGFSTAQNRYKIQKFQNRAARIITKNFDYINSRGLNLVNELKIMNLAERRNYLMSSLMYKAVYGIAPRYLCDQINLINEISERTTRSSESLNVCIPISNLNKHFETLTVAGGNIWNALPHHLKKAPSLYCFKKDYKTWFWADKLKT